MRNVVKISILGLIASFRVCFADPLIVAHRGASKDAPENTIPAFELAWKQGADAIEGDFHLSRDGEIICIHDKDTRKTSGQNLKVRKSTLYELRQLDVGKYHSAGYAGTRVPTLAEVFQTVPQGKKFYIEIKSGPKLVPKLIEEIAKSGLDEDQIVVISFKENVIRALKARAPQYKAMWLSGFKESDSGKKTPSLNRILKTLKRIQADGFSSSKSGIELSIIKEVKASGYEYHVWTIDDGDTAKQLLEWGAQSITTNIPGEMREMLFEEETQRR